MNWIWKIITFSVLFLFIACKGDTNKALPPAGFNAERIMNMNGAMSKLLPVAMIAELLEIDSSLITTYYENFASDMEKHSILYHWPNGEVVEVEGEGGVEKVAAHSSIGIAFIHKTNLSLFNERYNIKEEAERRIAQLVNDESIAPDIAIAETKYIAANVAVQKLELVNDVGDMAFWEMPVQALHVFINGTAFTVTTNLNSDENVSKQKAIMFVNCIFNYYNK